MIPVNALTVVRAVLFPLVEEVPDPNDVKPGWIGGVVVVLLALAVVLLLFSFRKQLRKVDFEPPADGDETKPKDGPAGAGNGRDENGGAGSGERP